MTSDFVEKVRGALLLARPHVANAYEHANSDEATGLTAADLDAIDSALGACLIAGALAKLTPEERKALGY